VRFSYNKLFLIKGECTEIMEGVGEEHTICFPHRSKHAKQRTWGCWQRIQIQNVETLEDFRDEVEMSGLDEDGKKEVYKILKENLEHERYIEQFGYTEKECEDQAQLLVAEEMFFYSSAMKNERIKGKLLRNLAHQCIQVIYSRRGLCT